MSIYTSDSTMITKLDHLCEKYDYYKCVKINTANGKQVSKEYEAPKRLLTLRKMTNLSKTAQSDDLENSIEPDEEIIEEE